MDTSISIDPYRRFIRVRQIGALTPESVMAAREASTPMFNPIDLDRVLVDYRQADLSLLSLLEIDALGMKLKDDVPLLQKMALIYAPSAQDHLYRHIENICSLSGVETRIFTSERAATDWLLKPLEPIMPETADFGPCD